MHSIVVMVKIPYTDRESKVQAYMLASILEGLAGKETKDSVTIHIVDNKDHMAI